MAVADPHVCYQLGLLLSVVFIGAAPRFVSSFVPGPVTGVSIRYVRTLSFGACLGSMVETSVAIGTKKSCFWLARDLQ